MDLDWSGIEIAALCRGLGMRPVDYKFVLGLPRETVQLVSFSTDNRPPIDGYFYDDQNDLLVHPTADHERGMLCFALAAGGKRAATQFLASAQEHRNQIATCLVRILAPGVAQ